MHFGQQPATVLFFLIFLPVSSNSGQGSLISVHRITFLPLRIDIRESYGNKKRLLQTDRTRAGPRTFIGTGKQLY